MATELRNEEPLVPRDETEEQRNDADVSLTLVERLVSNLRWNLRVLLSSADRFYWDDCFSKASSLAYTSLLSLVPVTVLAFGLIASFAISPEFINEVRAFLFKQFVPDDAFVNDVLTYIRNFNAAIAQLNVVFVLFLVVTSLLLINSIEYALNATWQVFEPRPIAQRLMIFSSIVLIAPVLLLSVYYFVDQLRIPEAYADIWLVQFVFQSFVPFVIDFLAFTLLYWLVPKAPVRLSSAMYGAFVAGVLFALAKYGFALYLKDFATYNTVYKSLAAIPIFLLWLYLAWSVVLFGAESSYQSQYLPRNGRLWKRSLLSVGDARMVLAVQALVVICRCFRNGAKMPNDLELAERLGCSSIVLKPTIDALEKAGIVARGDSRDMPLTLMRDPERITLNDLRSALFRGDILLRFPQELERLFASMRSGKLSTVSLSDIMATS